MLAQIKVVGRTGTERIREEDKCISVYEKMNGEKTFRAASYQFHLVLLGKFI